MFVEIPAIKYKGCQAFSFPHLLKRSLGVGLLRYLQGQWNEAEMKKQTQRRREIVLKEQLEEHEVEKAEE